MYYKQVLHGPMSVKLHFCVINIHMSVLMAKGLFLQIVCLSVSLSVCLFVCLSVCLFVCFFVCVTTLYPTELGTNTFGIKNIASYFVSSSYFSFTFSEKSRMFPTYLRGCFISGM
jgi:hypothetical protein